MILKMALRNLFRHKKRSVITISSMVFGIMLTMFANGLNKGVERQIIDIYIKTEIGQVKLYEKGYYEDRENNERLDYIIENSKGVEKIIDDRYNENLVFNAVLSTGEEDYPVLVKGVKKESENDFFKRDKDIIKGSFLENRDEIVLGEKIAELLNINIGDSITLVARTEHGSINAYDKTVGGLIKTDNSILNIRDLFMNLDEAQELALSKGVNEIILAKLPAMDKLSRLEKNYDIVKWDQELGDILALMKMKIRNTIYVGAFIMLIAAVGIINTMLMAMLEREKEIGVLMANGMSESKIMSLFVLEGSFIGIIGSGLGFVLGGLSVYFSAEYGIPLPAYTDFGIQMAIPDRMYAYFDLKEFLLYFLTGVVIAVISSFYAAYKASKLNPVEILHRT